MDGDAPTETGEASYVLMDNQLSSSNSGNEMNTLLQEDTSGRPQESHTREAPASLRETWGQGPLWNSRLGSQAPFQASCPQFLCPPTWRLLPAFLYLLNTPP